MDFNDFVFKLILFIMREAVFIGWHLKRESRGNYILERRLDLGCKHLVI